MPQTPKHLPLSIRRPMIMDELINVGREIHEEAFAEHKRREHDEVGCTDAEYLLMKCVGVLCLAVQVLLEKDHESAGIVLPRDLGRGM